MVIVNGVLVALMESQFGKHMIENLKEKFSAQYINYEHF